MQAILAALRARVVGNPRTTVWGGLLAVMLVLLWLGADAITALTAEVTALNGLLSALTDGWHALAGVPAVLMLLLAKDTAK
jgi:hypothetical protein